MMFDKLNEINVSDKTEKKGGLTYLPWAYAWQTLKLHCPDAQYTVYENNDGLNYHHDSITAWVKVGVTVNDLEHIEYLPVMDFRNKSITVDKLTSFDVNKAIKRALVKAIAMHGLGITIYAGEDLPEQPTQKPANQPPKPAQNGDKATDEEKEKYIAAAFASRSFTDLRDNLVNAGLFKNSYEAVGSIEKHLKPLTEFDFRNEQDVEVIVNYAIIRNGEKAD